MSADPRPVLISLLGPSGSGKTTLAAELVRLWTEQGLRVGYVKHASHGFTMDRDGKDTARVTGSGGAGVAVTGPQGTAYLDATPDVDPLSLVARFFPERDVVVVEGFRDAGLPTALLLGADDDLAFIERVQGPLLAILAPATSPAAEAARTRNLFTVPREEVDAVRRHLEQALPLP